MAETRPSVPGEMVPAERAELARSAIGHEQDCPAGGEFTDAGNGNAAEPGRHARQIAPGDGEQQLVVFSAVERTAKPGGALIRRFGATSSKMIVECEGKGSSVDHRACTARSAQAGEIGGEAVRNVHGSGGESVGGQPRADGEARFGAKMADEKIRTGMASERARAFALQEIESGLCRAQATGDEDGIAGIAAAPREYAGSRRFADYGNGGVEVLVAGNVAADQMHAEPTGGAGHAASKLVEPGACFPDGQGKRQKEIARPGSHGRQVARGASQRFEADGIGRMNTAEKMAALDERVCAHHPIAAAPRADYSGIVTNAAWNIRRVTRADAAWDLAREAGDDVGFRTHASVLMLRRCRLTGATTVAGIPHGRKDNARRAGDLHGKIFGNMSLEINMLATHEPKLLDFNDSGSLHSRRVYSGSRSFQLTFQHVPVAGAAGRDSAQNHSTDPGMA